MTLLIATFLAVLLRHYAGRPEYAGIRAELEAASDLLEAGADPQPLTAAETAAMLRVKEAWLREQVRLRRIPFHQAVKGGAVMFDRAEVLRWWRGLGHKEGRRG